ncbi:hypothetical protein KQH54_00070 [bacterium]|nr:hypothetical protein [bacterium]
MKSRKKQYDDDDGRVIINMNVEGMRGFDRKVRLEKPVTTRNAYSPQLSRSEARQYTRYSLLAVSLIVFVFSATWVLFTLFCLYVWFR